MEPSPWRKRTGKNRANDSSTETRHGNTMQDYKFNDKIKICEYSRTTSFLHGDEFHAGTFATVSI